MSEGAEKSNCSIPRHVAVIMDGNGRWAAQHGRPRFSGHRAGVKSARHIVDACAEGVVETLSFFALICDNW